MLLSCGYGLNNPLSLSLFVLSAEVSTPVHLGPNKKRLAARVPGNHENR